MKGKLKKLITSISLFLLGASSTAFAAGEADLYGPPSGFGSEVPITGNTITNHSGILTIVTSIILFIIGLLIILNKKIKRTSKIIICSILGIILIGLIAFYYLYL